MFRSGFDYWRRFEAYVLEVATATRERGGVTSDPLTLEFLPPTNAWGFPKYPERTIILSPATDLTAALKRFIEANEGYLREPDCRLGTWVNPQTGDIYLDITTSRENLDEARVAAREASLRGGRRIVALFNTSREETVYLQGDPHQ